MKHCGPISGVAAHGNLVATAGYDNQLLLWDARTRTSLARGYHDHLVNQVSFSPDGSKLASASSDYSVRIWDVPKLQLRTVINGHDDDIEMVAFSPDGGRIATCSRDRRVHVYETSGQLISTMVGHSDDVISVAWSANGQNVLSSSDDGTVRLWDSVTGAQIQVFDFDGVQTDALVVTSDGCIIIGDDNGQLIVTRDGVEWRVKAHSAGVKRLVLSQEHGRIASLSYDRSMAIWAVNDDLTLTELDRTEFPAVVWPRSGAFMDRNRIATGTFGSSYAVYDLERKLWQLETIESYSSFNAVCAFQGKVYSIGDAGILNEGGQPIMELGSLCNFLLGSEDILITGGQLGKIFDAIGGDLLHQHHSPVNCGTVFYRDGKEFAALGTYTGEMIVLDLSSRPVSHVTTRPIHDNAIKGIAANAQHIFSVSASAEAAYTTIDDLMVIKKIHRAHEKIANGCIAIDGGFASISRDLHLRLWRQGEAIPVCSPHQNSIKCITADPTGRIIATGSYSGTIHVFDVEHSKWIYGVRPTAAGISSLTFSNELKAFIASSYDGSLYDIPLEEINGIDGIDGTSGAVDLACDEPFV